MKENPQKKTKRNNEIYKRYLIYLKNRPERMLKEYGISRERFYQIIWTFPPVIEKSEKALDR